MVVGVGMSWYGARVFSSPCSAYPPLGGKPPGKRDGIVLG
jgi:hypothetical protein